MRGALLGVTARGLPTKSRLAHCSYVHRSRARVRPRTVSYTHLDVYKRQAKGLAPIQPWLNKIRAVEKPGLAALLAEADRSGVGHFFGGYVGQDDKNPEVYTYIIFQGGIGMPDRDFYLKENERNTALQAAYLKHLENVLTLAGEANAAARAKAIYDLSLIHI